MDRIHEMETHHIGRTLGSAAYSCDGDTRGIGSKTDFGRDHTLQMFVDCPLDFPVFGDVLDHEITRSNLREIGRQGHALQRLTPGYPWQRFVQQRGETYVVQDFGLSALQDVFRNIHHDRGNSVKNEIGYDAGTDVSRAKYAYSCEFHATKLSA